MTDEKISAKSVEMLKAMIDRQYAPCEDRPECYCESLQMQALQRTRRSCHQICMRKFVASFLGR